MPYFDGIDVSEGTDINKTSASKECGDYHHWYFLNKGFKVQPYKCNKCHDFLMMSMNLSYIATLSIKNVDYCCIIAGISEGKAIKLLQNIDLIEKSGTL